MVHSLFLILLQSTQESFTKDLYNLMHSTEIQGYMEKTQMKSSDKYFFLVMYQTLRKKKNHFHLLSKKDLEELQTQLKKTDSFCKSLSILFYKELELSKPESHKNVIHYYPEKNVSRIESLHLSTIDSYQQIVNKFNTIQYFKKSSASFSLIFTLQNHLNQRYYLKIYPEIPHTNVDVESKMYNEIYKLIKYGITPNVLSRIFAGKLKGFYESLYPIMSATDKKKIDHQIHKINHFYDSNKDHWNETYAILTESGEIALEDLLETTQIHSNEMKHILFQILYTLYVFKKLEISHGDLHLGNIFIHKIPKRIMYYLIDETYYKIETNYLVKIYDFDSGMIMKKTQMKINQNQMISIHKVINYDRKDNEIDSLINGITSIYNEKVETINFFLDLKYFLNEKHMKSFYYYLYYSIFHNQSIYKTYQELLKDPQNLKQFNTLYRLQENEPFSYHPNLSKTNEKYHFSKKIMNMNWNQYFEYIISERFKRRIIKNSMKTPLNHLWIPDDIFPSIEQIIQHSYFDSIIYNESIDLIKDPVFTLENRF